MSAVNLSAIAAVAFQSNFELRSRLCHVPCLLLPLPVPCFRSTALASINRSEFRNSSNLNGNVGAVISKLASDRGTRRPLLQAYASSAKDVWQGNFVLHFIYLY